MQLQGYGLWNISRGLARNMDAYKMALSYADTMKQGIYDRRENLPSKTLEKFVEYMLTICLDQISYMERYFKPSELSLSIDSYVKRAHEKEFDKISLPKKSDRIFKQLLLVGESQRSILANVIDVSDRTMTTILKELLEKRYLVSSSPKGPVRLKLNAHFFSFLFPELVPSAKN